MLLDFKDFTLIFLFYYLVSIYIKIIKTNNAKKNFEKS
jgi:hypothetical protein